MEIFSEIYNCYYQVLRHLLCRQDALTIQDIRRQVYNEGFEESMLSIIPKLENGTWDLFERDGNVYRSKISSSFTIPVSHLEKSYLKALLSDPRIGLFLNKEQLEKLNNILISVTPLWKQEQFCYYDQFSDGDPYDNEKYRYTFRTLLYAQKNCKYVDIDYTSPKGNRVHHYYVPARLEYSVKNDKFRILALRNAEHGKIKLETLNISRIQNCSITEKPFSKDYDLNSLIRNSYYKEPVKLLIKNKRNTLERAMLHFANYEKNTTKIDDDTYECLIYYNKSMETELLVEVMSFGPMLIVQGNKYFLKKIKERLKRQLEGIKI